MNSLIYTKSNKICKIINLSLLILAGSAIFELPYIRYNYYDVMKQSFSLNNTQIGDLMSVYGLISMLCYFPGGWLADRFSCKKLLTFSLVSTGLLGLFYSAFPPFGSCMAIHIIWAVTSTLTFWAPMVKAVNSLGSSNTHGKLFGLLEGGRGLAPMLYGTAFLFLFNQMGAGAAGFRFVIIAYSLLTILSGILIALFFKETETTCESPVGIRHNELLRVVKMPGVWLMGLLVFSAYFLYAGLSYLTAYLTEVYSIPASTSVLLGLFRTYLLAVLIAPVSGIVRDKAGTPAVLRAAFAVTVFCAAALLFLRQAGAVIAVMILLGLAVFAARGVYFSVLDDVGIPAELTGAAIGFASLIGFIPDAFIYVLYGYLLDRFPGMPGYRIIFASMLVSGALGLLLCAFLTKKIRNLNKPKETKK